MPPATRDHTTTTSFADTLTLSSIQAGAAKIVIDPFLSDDPSWYKAWIGAVQEGTRTRHEEAGDEGYRGDGPGCGNGRDDAGGAAQAAGSDKRRRRSGSLVRICLD